MRRMIFIQKTKTIVEQSGSKLQLRANSLIFHDLVIPTGSNVRLYSFPLELKTIYERDFHLFFNLSNRLVDKGVVLVGAYYDGNQVRVSLINFGPDIRLMEKEAVLEVNLVEGVHFFQADPSGISASAKTNESTDKPKRKKK